MGKQIKINKKSDDKQKRITVSFKEVEDDLVQDIFSKFCMGK